MGDNGKEAEEAAVGAAKRTASGGTPDEVTLKSGIILKCRGVPPYVQREVLASITVPEIPKVRNEQQDRDEENPNDPEYAKAVAAYDLRVAEAGDNLYLLSGTRPKLIPDGVCTPEDDAWIEDLAANLIAIGEPLTIEREKERLRYLHWVKYYALSSSAELLLVIATVGRLSGVTEEDVASAAEGFPGGKGRGVDNAPAAKRPDGKSGDKPAAKTRRASGRSRRT